VEGVEGEIGVVGSVGFGLSGGIEGSGNTAFSLDKVS